jgi:carbonic anhydrase/acetyltransferase-like protein (isoleucine patch superfamily)
MKYKVIKYKDLTPKIEKGVYISEGVVLAGDVQIKSGFSIWFNSVLRGDIDRIKIGSNTNIQDGTVIHTSRFNGPVEIGNNVTVGHMALVHACTLQDNAFVGMRAAVMDHAVVEEYGFVASGSLVTPRKVVKSKELWARSPARFVRYLTDEELSQMQDTIKIYCELAKCYSDDYD